MHLFIKLGLQEAAWTKFGNVGVGFDIDLPHFRESQDYGNPSIKISKMWNVWKVNDQNSRYIGELTPEYQNYDLGGVWPVEALLEILNTGKSSWVYPGY